jgi:gliding motility-associated-like protein
MRNRLLLALALPVLSAPTLCAQVVVNEVSASNWTTIQDNFNRNEDWIELYNTAPAAVDLGGWYLSDSQNNNTKYQFPAGATIPGNGHLLVWCTGRNASFGNVHHASFRLNQTDEERAVLSDPSGTIVSNFKLEQRTKTDHSWGRTEDGAATWNIFTTPTPGAPNVDPRPYYAAMPQFNLEPGFYGGGINLELSSPEPGVQIRYTLDGSEPTAASTLYAGPIAIGQTTVVRAFCIPADPAIPTSFVETNTYFINVSHSVNVISVSGDQMATLFGGTQIEPLGHLEYFNDAGEFKGEAGGEYNKHGNDSWAYPQRGVDFIARDAFGLGDGMRFKVFRTKNRQHFQRLILKAGASDNYPFENGGAHIRDAYVQALSHEGNLRLDERTYEPCVVYMNGQYWGVYEVREKVDDHDFTEHYYDQNRYNLQFLKTWGGTWQEYGAPDALNDWNALRNYINTNNMGDPAAFAYVESQFNWKSLVDYFVLNSYIVSKDWLNWNTGWWRGMNPFGSAKRWRYILWDMDACFGHYANFTNIPDDSPDADPCNVENLPNPGGQGHTVILQKLMAENEQVRDFYVNRYIDLGNTVFSCDNMLPFLDSLINLIAPEMPGHVARWGGSMNGWENNVQEVRDFIETRCTAIQAGLIDCYELEGPYDVVFNVNPPEAGRIRINSITPDDYPFSGIYYGGINTTLAPIPATDWVFSHWEVTGSNTILPSTTDSLVTLDFMGPDSIIAHFVPPIRYEILLDVFPKGGGTITFDGQTYEDFPVLVSAPENTDINFHINPTLYYDFLYWEVLNNVYSPYDSSETHLTARFFTTDTIIAYLQPQEYHYYVPNAFTPNGDGINDVFFPIGNVIELSSYELQIFDRWGQLLFESRDPGIGWDGNASGQAMPDGVYVYRAYVVDAIEGARNELFGHVTLIR